MATVIERYKQFSENMDKEDAELVKVFEPLSQKLMDDLHLIREASKTLQQKKDDELARAAQAAKEAEEKQKEKKEPETEEIKGEEAKEENVKDS